jgi:hypothetical protein
MFLLALLITSRLSFWCLLFLLCVGCEPREVFWEDVVWLWGRQLSTDREIEPVIGAEYALLVRDWRPT